MGTIANRQIFKRAPRAYAAAKIDGPVLAPIDPTKPLDAKLPVRCADCHSAAPLENTRPLAENPPPLGRCSHCHVAHVRVEEWRDERAPLPTLSPERGEGRAERRERRGLSDLARGAGVEVSARGRRRRWRSARGATRSIGTSGRWCTRRAGCSRSTPTATATRRAIPAADRRAGGIGTEPLLAFDVPITQRPFSFDVAVIPDPVRAGHVGHARIGAAWVRAAPLVALRASAPYLHNGSVPTLRALLEPAARRPVCFPLGAAGFVLDTRVAGNGNQGHEFGTSLSPAEKQDLVRFLETL